MKKVFVVLFSLVTVTLFAQRNKDIDNLIASERFDDADSASLKLLKTDVKNPYVYFALGESALKSYINDPYSDTKGNVISKAKNYFRDGIKVDSLNPLNYVGFGIIELFDKNDTIKADKMFAKAMSFIPAKSLKKKKITDIQIWTLLKLETAELYSSTPRVLKSENYNNLLQLFRSNMPEIYIAYGDVLMSQNNASEAITKYKKALLLENTALSNVLIAKIYYAARNVSASGDYFQSAIRLDPNFAPAYKGLGDVYYKLNNIILAKYNYGRFLELTGNNIPAKINYLKAIYKAKDYDETIKIADDILKVDSSKTYIYRLVAYSATDKKNPDYAIALKNIEKLFAKTPEKDLINKDFSYYSKILFALNRDSNDIKLGVKMVEKLYLSDTTNSDNLVELIKTALLRKQYDVAIKYLSKKINTGDDTPNNYLLLGKTYYYNDEFLKADSVFTLLLKRDSASVETWQWKAYALTSVDQNLKLGLAKNAYLQIIDLTEKDSSQYVKERFDACMYVSSSYLFSKNVDYKKAEEYAQKSLDISLKNNEWLLKSYSTLAFIYHSSKQWEKAKNAYEKVLQLKPKDQNATKALQTINDYLTKSKK